MGTKVGLIACLLLLTIFGPTLADSRVQELQDLLAEVSTELARQLDILAQQEEQGLAEQVVATRQTILDLVAKERTLLDSLERIMRGEATAPAKPAPPETSQGLQAVVNGGLAWLASHQSSQGFWHAERYWEESGFETIDGLGRGEYTIGVTSLALLAFLDAGHTYRKGEYRKTLKDGFAYLKSVQDEEGCFGSRDSRHFIYNHAIATLAMVRHYGATKVVAYKRSAQNGIEFLLACRNPGSAWRYGVRPKDNDTSVTGWTIAALAAAKDARIDVDPLAFTEPREWIDKVTNPETGHVGYEKRDSGPARSGEMLGRFPARLSAATTAEGIAIRLACGVDPSQSALLKKGLKHMMALRPSKADNAIDLYYWFWGTQVACTLGGDTMKLWREPMQEIVLASSLDGPRIRGSFAPSGPWGPDGGRVYSTALTVMIAEMLRTGTAWNHSD
jgi:hypothetical protein